MEKIKHNIRIIKEQLDKILCKVEEDFGATTQAMSPTPLLPVGKIVSPTGKQEKAKEDKKKDEYEI